MRGKDSACSAMHLDRSGSTTCGTTTTFGTDYNQSRDEMQWYNRPSHHKKLPYQLRDTMSRLITALDSPCDTVTDLQHHKNGRQVREEKRKNSLNLLRVLIDKMDWETFIIGTENDDETWACKTQEELALNLNVHVSTVKRAQAALVENDYLITVRQYNRSKDGRYKGKSSIKILTTKIFKELGIKYQKLFSLVNYKRERRYKKELKKTHKSKRAQNDFLYNMSDIFRNLRRRSKKSVSNQSVSNQTITTYSYDRLTCDQKKWVIDQTHLRMQADTSKTMREHWNDLINECLQAV